MVPVPELVCMRNQQPGLHHQGWSQPLRTRNFSMSMGPQVMGLWDPQEAVPHKKVRLVSLMLLFLSPNNIWDSLHRKTESNELLKSKEGRWEEVKIEVLMHESEGWVYYFIMRNRTLGKQKHSVHRPSHFLPSRRGFLGSQNIVPGSRGEDDERSQGKESANFRVWATTDSPWAPLPQLCCSCWAPTFVPAVTCKSVFWKCN